MRCLVDFIIAKEIISGLHSPETLGTFVSVNINIFPMRQYFQTCGNHLNITVL